MVIFNSYVSHYQRVSYQNGFSMVKLPREFVNNPYNHAHITTKKVEQHTQEGVRCSDERR